MDKTLIREALEKAHTFLIGYRLNEPVGSDEAWNSVLAALAELSNAPEGEGWVSVKDRLPDANGRSIEGWGVGWSDCDKVYYGTAEDFDPDSLIEEDRVTEILWRWMDGTPIRDQSVTHWRPRPLPPPPMTAHSPNTNKTTPTP